jgi:FKBP-type peptidyl-prolyl cis-trans isomerase (trigger factor)
MTTPDLHVVPNQPEPRPVVTPFLAETMAEAQPYVFRVSFSKDALQSVLDHWWKEQGPATTAGLIQRKQGVKGGKTNGKAHKLPTRQEAAKVLGEWGMYDPLLQELMLNALNEKVWPKQVIFTTDNNLLTDEKTITLSVRYFLWPEVTLGDVNSLEISLPRPTEGEIEAVLHDHKEMHRQTKSREHEKVVDIGEPVVEDGDIAVVTMNPKVDGKPWQPGTLKHNKMRVQKGHIHPEELYEKLLGLTVGNHFFEFTLNEKYAASGMAGKVVEMEMTIHTILTYALLPWEDELAKELGFDSLDILNETYRRQVTQHLNRQWEQKASSVALEALVSKSTFAPVPQDWLRVQTEAKYTQHLNRFKGVTNDLFKAWGVKSKDPIVAALAQAARYEAFQLAALYAYAEVCGVEISKEKDCGHTGNILSKAMGKLLENVKIVVPGAQTTAQLEAE